MNLKDYAPEQLAEWRGQVRMNIAALERKGAPRTVAETRALKEQRSLLRRLTREIRARFVQPRLF